MEIIKFDEIDSTQNYAKKIAQEGKKDVAICSRVQKNGRGRIGNKWQSLEGGLWFSFITDVTMFSLDKLSFFTLILGVSVYQVCTTYYNAKLQLKWPNDLLLNNKKICGILCEKSGNKIISGVGINTNIDSENLIECATSFRIETNNIVDNIELMKSIIDKFYDNLSEFDKSEILKIYRENMAYINEKKFVKAINKEVIIKGIDNDGALIIEENGAEKKITFGEI